MRNGRLLTLGLLALLVLTSPVFANEKPPELDGLVKANKPYGKASFTRFLFHVYDAEIWMDSAEWSYQVPFALSITYAMSLSADELAVSTLQQARKMTSVSLAQEKKFAAYLGHAYRDVRSGDRISALFVPPDNITFFVNAAQTATVNDAAFARLFFGIWLSERTSEPSLRAGLLGLKS